MSDKSFGDHTGRSVVKNPLLSTSVVGLSVQDLSSNAVLLPVAQSTGLISSQDGQLHHRPAGDANPNPLDPKPTPLDPKPQTDDFDVSEYFARLQGTRYVSAPVNTNTELEKTALEQAEEHLEEINLNEQPIQQSITSDIAQNFSQLPQVLPQVASAVFSSFSSMLSYKSRDVTPEIESKAEGLREQVGLQAREQGPGLVMDRGPGMKPVEVGTEPAPAPPKDVLGGTQNTFRITTKKKSYAQIPGLSSGETVSTNQFSKPPQAASTPFYLPSFESGQPNSSAQMTKPSQSTILGQAPPQTSFGMPGFESGSGITSQSSGQVQGQPSQPVLVPGFQPEQQQPPIIRQSGLYNQGNREVAAVTSQIQDDFMRSAQANLTENVPFPSGASAVAPFRTQDGAENIASTLQDAFKKTKQELVNTSTAFNPPQALESMVKPVEHTLAFRPQNPPTADPSPTMQISNPAPPKTCQNEVYTQNPNSFSSIQGKGTPHSIIPPPTMFSNQRRDSKTDVGKTILPPSVARRLAGNQPLAKQPLNQTTFPANIFVPAPLNDQTSQESIATASNSSDLAQLPLAFSSPQIPGLRPMSSIPTFGRNIPSNIAPSSNILPAPTFAAASNVSSLSRNATVMPPPSMFTNPTSSAPKQVEIPAVADVYNTPDSANQPYTTTATPTQMFNPTAFVTTELDQKMVQNILELPNPTFDPIAFTTNLPEPPKAVPEPPKLSSGNTNFRLSKKRPQYYSGPIEGVGSISNNVKPIIPQIPNQGIAYQGVVFSPDPMKSAEVPTLDVNQAYILPSVSLETSTVPFDLSKPAQANIESNIGYSIHDRQQNIICDEINTAFDFSRQTTESFDQPKQESIGFGLIGSLKSKLSALDINKIQNSVTTFFDPGYNDVKAEPDNRDHNNYGQISASTDQNYGQTTQYYGQSRQNYGPQDQQTNLEIFIPNSQQMPDQIFNQQCYDSTFNQCQSSNMNVHGLQSNNQYFPEHYNYYQHPTQNPTDVQSYYSPHSTNTYAQQRPAQNPPTAEQIQEINTTNVYNSNVYNFNQMTEDVTSKDFFDHQHQKNVNQYGPGQADVQVVADNLFQNQTVGYQGSVPSPVNESHPPHGMQVGENVSSSSLIEKSDPHVSPDYSHEYPTSNETKEVIDPNKDLQACKDFLSNSSKPVAESSETKYEEKKSVGTPSVSKEEEPKIDISKEHLFDLSSSLADNYKEIEETLEDLTLKDASSENFDDRKASFFFDNYDRKELNEPKNDEDITDLKMCETCREVNSGDSSKTDLTSQLIQNITAPIQLSNPVEVPLTGIDNPLLDSLQYVSNPCQEISHVTEETIEAIQMHLATELLDRKDIAKFEQRHEIPEVTNYGWCDQSETQDIERDLADPNIKNIKSIHDYAFHTDPNAVGLISDNSLFFDDMPNNASDEIKAEFKSAHEEPILLSRQMSIPSAPTEEDLIITGLDVQLIEQDAKMDFPVYEEFIIEPSTDDDKAKERERSESEEEVNMTDSFTNRVERFKKSEESVEPAAPGVIFDVQTSTSPSMTIASYFDTGNYAADTHYRNSLTSPSSMNAMNLGVHNRNVSILPSAVSFSKGDKEDVNKPLFPDVDGSIYRVPDVGTQTTIVTTTTTANVCTYTTTTSAFTPTFCLPERSFIPQPSAIESLPSDLFATQSSPRDNVSESKPSCSLADVSKELVRPQEVFQSSNVAPHLPDPINFFATDKPDKNTEDAGTNRLASYFASPAKPADNTKSFFELSQGQDHLKDNTSKNWECTQSYKSFFESDVAEVEEAQQDFSDISLRKPENTKQERQSLGKEQESANLPQNWESTQSFKSYFDTDEERNTTNEDVNKNKTLYEMTQSQNVTYTPEQYSANLQLIKDLTSASNFLPTEDQVVRTVNYNSVLYANRSFKSDLSTGEPRPKNSDEKFPFNEKFDNLYVKSNLEEAAVPDDSKLEMLVHKCKLCCNLDSGRVVVFKDIKCADTKVRKAMDGNSGEGTQEPNMTPEKGSEPIPNVSFPMQSSCALKCEDDKEDPNATLADNRVTTEYTPVRHHWFYRVDAEGKSIWRGFSVTDNDALEEAFNSPELSESTVVATDGGRFDVNVVGRLRVAVYWADKPTNVRRCSWFYKGTTDARYVPYTEAVAEKLEEEYRHGVSTGEWHRRLVLPNNEAVVMHGPAVMVHFLQSSAADAWSGGAFFQFGKCVYRNPPKIRVAKDQTEKIDHLLLLVHGAGEWKNQREKIQSTMRPRVVRRGYDESEIEDPEPSSIDHLLLLCHGVGSACDMRFRSVEEVVDDFRATSLQLIQGHYRSSYDEGIVGRVEVLPVSWHSTLHSGEGGVDRRLARITLESIPRLRSFTNDTVLDVLFYTSPVFCQTIIDEVCKELNRIYALFRQRNPSFDGGVSLGGHSLGSVILYDLLCHQLPKSPESGTSNKAEKLVTGAAGTGQPTVRYPTLHFTPQALYALGSPIAIFECIRGVDCLGEQFALPNCKNFFNIFHPYDPIAYRIEPLINPQLKNVSPFLIPHHKGRKRMHLELKETVARVGADLKQKLLESIKTTWSSMWRSQPPPPGELEKVVEEQLEREGLTDEAESGEAEDRPLDVDTKELLGQLNAGRRVDYVLQEAPFEMINEYLFAMSSHVCYWESEDTMLLMLREIYDALGVQPDCCLPQQTMAVQRTRHVANSEDAAANSDMATTSGVQLEKS